MSTTILGIIIFAGIAGITTSGNSAELIGSPSMRIFYVNFGVAPYAGYTRADVEQYPLFKIYFYGKHRFNSRLVSMFEAKPATDATLDLRAIRLIAITNTPKDASYVVDEHGLVLEEKSNSRFLIDRETMNRIDEMITSYHGVVDQLPLRDVWGEDTEKWYPVTR